MGDTGRFGISMRFDSEISVIETQVSLDFPNLLTRIGGAIGVGKELFWIIIFTTTFLHTLYTRVKNK